MDPQRRPLPPMFRNLIPADRKCGICQGTMGRMMHVVGHWFCCPRCDAPL